MLNIKKFVCNMFQENCYVVSDETDECIIIDCGTFFEEEKKSLAEYIKSNGLKPKHLLCTHGHVDHNFGNKFVYDEFGLQPEISQADEQLINSLSTQAKAFTGMECTIDVLPVGSYIDEKSKIKFGSHVITVIPTPGHSPGSVFLYCKEEALAFSGDTLFNMSVGRTDLGLGNFDELMKSLGRIAESLPQDTTILPGHGPKTNIGFETSYNPYLKAVKKTNG